MGFTLRCIKTSASEAYVEKISNVELLELLFKFVRRGHVKQYELIRYFNHGGAEDIQEIPLSPNVHEILLGKFTFVKDDGAKEKYSVALFGENMVLIQTDFIELAQNNE